MKRSEFLKKLGIGLVVAVVAPTLLADNTGKEEIKPLVLPKPTDNPNRPLTSKREYSPLVITLTEDTEPSFCGSRAIISTDSKYLRWNDAILIPAEFTNKHKAQLFMCVPPHLDNTWEFLPFNVKAKIKKPIPKGTHLMITGNFNAH